MLVNYRFAEGTVFTFPPYEGALAIKVLRMLIKEMEKWEMDPSEFQRILVLIAEENCRKQ